jgi:hypothetical protein
VEQQFKNVARFAQRAAQKGALLPPYAATVDMPRCLLGQHPVTAPGKMGYFKTLDKEAMFVICERCAAKIPNDAELEQKIIDNLLETAVAAADNPPVPPATAWATRAAKEWVRPAQGAQSTPAA